MPRINLLPWRAEQRAQRQRHFLTLAGAAALSMGAIVALTHFQVEQWIEDQNARNTYLDVEIAMLDKRLAEISDLEKERENLLARMRIVEQLQTSRPEVVHLFTEIVAAIPEGVFLTSIAQKDRNVTLEGLAQSNARVSSFMRSLDASPWLGTPDLKRIQASATKAEQDGKQFQFQLMIGQTNPFAPASVEGKPAQAQKAGQERKR